MSQIVDRPGNAFPETLRLTLSAIRHNGRGCSRGHPLGWLLHFWGCAECCGNVCFRSKRTFSRSLYKQSLYFRKRPKPEVRDIVINLYYAPNSDLPIDIAIGYRPPADNIQGHGLKVRKTAKSSTNIVCARCVRECSSSLSFR